MKNLLKNVITFLLILTVLGTAVNVPANAASTPKLTKTKLTIIRTQKKKITLKGTNKTVKWSTSNKKVAVVKKSGKNAAIIQAKKAGKVTIKAKAGSKVYTCKVTVNPAGLNKTKVSLKKGKTTTLKVIGSKKVKWTTSNKKVVAIAGSKTSPRVKIKAVKAGTAYVRAKIGKKTYKCKVTVRGTASKKKASKFYEKRYTTGPTVTVHYFRKGDVSVKVVPYLKHKDNADRYSLP